MSNTFGYRGSGNFSKFQNHGHLRSYGEATTFYDVLGVFTTGKQGATTKPDFDYSRVGYLFPQNNDTEIIYMIIQFNHNYKQGSDVIPHWHYLQESADVPTFKMSFLWFNNGDATQYAAAWKTAVMDDPVFSYTSGDLPQINTISDVEGLPATAIDGTGMNLSSIMLIKLYRDDNDVTGDVLSWSFDLHMEDDGSGSDEEYIK